MDQIEISPQFEQVLKFINETDRTVFLTGKAGTGKTTLLKYIRQNTHKQMAVCAPTGVAAINAGGSTIHSFFQFPFTPFLPGLKENGDLDTSGSNLPTLKYNAQRLAIFRNLELLVIDEISMVRADLLDQIDITLRHTRRRWQQPFGGVQLLLIGDMYQLPPVVQGSEWDLLGKVYPSPYFFESFAVKRNSLVYIELEKIYRQSEEKFIGLLNKVRSNELDDEAMTALNVHYKADLNREDYARNITLTTHNRKADEINSRNLEALPGKKHHFKAEVTGIFPDRNYPADPELVLKVGTRVMFLKNNAEKNYYNGKIGIVTQVEENLIKVKCDEDKSEIAVGKETWTNVTYKVDKATKHIEEDVQGTFIQYPLRLAWAITIHKSQGLTFDKLIIDAAESFSAGQVYVALSRCRSLEGLTLSSRIIRKSLHNDHNILQFSSARPAHNEVESIFHSARHGYMRSVLLSLFDFTDLLEIRKELAGLMIVHAKRMDPAGKTWMEEILPQLDMLHSVGQKFIGQLGSLADAAADLEADENLNTRLSQASAYFSGELLKAKDLLKNCALRTESREAADDLNPVLLSFSELLYAKNTLIANCAGGFNFAKHVGARLKMVYPAAKPNVYSSAANSKIAGDVKHPALFRQLIELRDEICQESHKPIYLVANAKTLAELCNYMPETAEQLLSISGFGKAKADAFGDAFLRLIRDYKHEHQLGAEFDFRPKKARKKKTAAALAAPDPASKISTGEKTLQLFRTGLRAEEIATQRGLTLDSIHRHLMPYVKAGEVSLHQLVPPAKEQVILEALSNFPPGEGITQVKAALPPDISFSDIRFVLAVKERAE